MNTHSILHAWIGLPQGCRVPDICENESDRPLWCGCLIGISQTRDAALRSAWPVEHQFSISMRFCYTSAEDRLSALKQISNTDDLLDTRVSKC